MKRALFLFFLLVLATGLTFQTVHADAPSCHFEADGSITCVKSGGGGGGNGNGGGGGNEGGECTPGDHLEYQVIEYPPAERH